MRDNNKYGRPFSVRFRYGEQLERLSELAPAPSESSSSSSLASQPVRLPREHDEGRSRPQLAFGGAEERSSVQRKARAGRAQAAVPVSN